MDGADGKPKAGSGRWRGHGNTMLLAFLLLALTNCGHSRGGNWEDLPPDERGAAKLSKILSDFKRALNAGDLESAEEILSALQEELAEATDVTRSHPDFQDIERAASRAPAALEKAHRVFAAKDHLKRIRERLNSARAALRAMEGGGITMELLGQMRSDITEAANLQRAGGEFAEIKSFPEQDERMVTEIKELAERYKELSFETQARAILGPIVAKAIENDEKTRAPGTTQEKLDAAQQANQAFAECRDQSIQLVEREGYNEKQQLDLGLGPLSLQELSLTCEFRRTRAEQLKKKARWRLDVEGAVAALSSTDGQRPPPAAFAECSRALAKAANEDPAFAKEELFDTPWGALSAADIQKRCESEAGASPSGLSSKDWHREARRVIKDGARAVRKAKKAGRSRRGAAKAKSALARCIEQAGLLRTPSFELSGPLEKEHQKVEAVSSQCQRALDHLERWGKKTSRHRKKSRKKRGR